MIYGSSSQYPNTIIDSTTGGEDEEGYVLERNMPGDPGYRLIDTIKAGETKYIDSTVSGGIEYKYRMKSYTEFAESEYSSESAVTTITRINDKGALPEKFALSQNYPNPFNPLTVINFDLPGESILALKVYNLLGQEVAVVINKRMPAGYHSLNFNAAHLTSGIYIYRLEAGGMIFIKKMILMK